MKVHIYTDIHPLFGASAMVWMRLLLAAGHDVEYLDIGVSDSAPLPDAGPCDLNIMVAGIYAFRRFARAGLPPHGRHAFWLMDPLTRDGNSAHAFKTALVEALLPRIHGACAIDPGAVAWLRAHYPALPVRHLPCLVEPGSIKPPLKDGERGIDVLWLGSDNERRRHAASLFGAAGVPAEFAFRHVWGAERDRMRQGARIVLQVHADASHTYFDQFRAVETWAAGSVVVAERSSDLADHGVIDGVHAACASLGELPALCRGLLADPPRRAAMQEAGQSLLRERFSPQAWRSAMLAFVDEPCRRLVPETRAWPVETHTARARIRAAA